MKKTSDTASKTKASDSALISARNARNISMVRWYLMIYPFGRKALPAGLDREIERRRKAGETPIEYFAPHYVEAKEVDGRIVTTDRQLFENYVFVRASIKEIFRMKQYEERYNLPRRQFDSNGEQYYPYISDEIIQNLKWIARSYSGVIPVYVDDTSWLIKGDRVRIISGPFKGVEATLFDNRKKNRKEIMVVIDNWMTVPLLHVKENQYRVVALNAKSGTDEVKINDELIPQLHEILCHSLSGKLTDEDIAFVSDIVIRFAGLEPHSDVMRCKLYSLLLMTYTILHDTDRRDNLLGIISVILPAVKAEQSKALLLTILYGCTDSSMYYQHAHMIVDPWRTETPLKKSKRQLIQFLADYDRILGH